jgi:hypothetical protein
VSISSAAERPEAARHPGRRPRAAGAIARLLVASLVAALLVVVVQAPQPTEAAVAGVSHPGVERTTPAVTSLSRGRIDLFWRSSSGTLRHRYRPAGGSWTRALDLGGSIASQPSAVSWGTGRIDVFARGTDGKLWQRTHSSDGWGAWRSRGGALTSAPAVVSQKRGSLDVFARDASGRITYRSFVQGTGWGSWRTLRGVVTSSPTAASWKPGRIDLFARGRDGSLVHRRYTAAGWSRWRSHGGRLASQPAAVSPGAGYLDVFMRGRDGVLRLKRRTPGEGFGRWRSLGVTLSAGPAAVAIGDDVRVVARDGSRWRTSVRRSPTASWGSWSRIDPYAPVRKLGTWVDIYDYGLHPETAVADMKAQGVRVLLLGTGRFSSEGTFHDKALMGRWLDAAHGRGMKVVGWYVPGYGDLARDVRRTVAIGNYVSPGGQRFDAIGINIERFRSPGQPVGQFTGEVFKDEFDTRLVTHLRRVRARTDLVTAAIVPTPYTTDPGNRWEGFPWAAVGRYSDVTVPMVLWSFRDGYSVSQVRSYVTNEIRRTRQLTGDPVHVEGGVDDPGVEERTPVTANRVQAFVDGAFAGGAIGGSHYDYDTTDPAFWKILRQLNGL